MVRPSPVVMSRGLRSQPARLETVAPDARSGASPSHQPSNRTPLAGSPKVEAPVSYQNLSQRRLSPALAPTSSTRSGRPPRRATSA